MFIPPVVYVFLNSALEFDGSCCEMQHKYGVVQSTNCSCVFYKQDEDGKQSTFNIFVHADTQLKDKHQVFAFIDNEQFGTQNWAGLEDMTIDKIMGAFRLWADDAPFMFEMEAQEHLGRCLGAVMKRQ